MNEMMEGLRVEGKNVMVQAEPVTVIPLPPLVPSNGSSWTSAAAKLYCCQSDPLGIIQQATEPDVTLMNGQVDSLRWLRGVL